MTYKLQSIDKEFTEKYHFRFDKSGYAIVFIDETSGTISMKTDWGDFAFSWSKSGRGTKTLKEFLVSVNYEYLMNKFCSRSYFSIEDAKKQLTESVHLSFASRDIDEDMKETCLIEIEEFTSSMVDYQDYLYNFEYYFPTIFEKVFLEDSYGIPIPIDYSPCEYGFFEEIWPIIVEELKKHI